MKFIWEASDFISTEKHMGVGQLVQHAGGETYIVGYATICTRPKRLVYVSLRDGMTNGPYTPEELAEQFNESGYVPLTDRVNAEARILKK